MTEKGLSLSWEVPPPLEVNIDDKIQTKLKVSGGDKVRHINIHICPAKDTFDCKIGRRDSQTEQGESNKVYIQSFTFKRNLFTPGRRSNPSLNDDGVAEYVCIGHANIDGDNVRTEPVYINVRGE